MLKVPSLTVMAIPTPDDIDAMIFELKQHSSYADISAWAREYEDSFSTAMDIFAPAIAILGVCLGARHSLKTWIALQQAPAPDKVIQPHAGPDGKPISKKRKLFMMLKVFTIVGALEFALLYGVPQWGGQSVADYLWATLILVFGMMNLKKFSNILRPASLRITRTKTGRFLSTRIRPTSDGAKARIALSAFLSMSVLTLWLLSMIVPEMGSGSRFLASLVCAATAARQTASFSGPLIRMKVFVIFMGLYPIVAFGPIIAGMLGDQGNFDLIQLYRTLATKSEEADPEADSVLGTSPWVNSMLMTLASGVIMGFPGYLAALALRFDYSRHVAANPGMAAVSVPLIDTPFSRKAERCLRKHIVPGLAGVSLPTGLPAFHKPIFHAAVFTIVAVWTLNYMLFGSMYWIGVCGLILPLESLAMIVAARKTGAWREFWGYSEAWWLKPTPESTEEEEALVAETVVATDSEKAEVKEAHVPAVAVDEKLIDIDA